MKKMRRLIPAIAMLLVSAVMLSTASFAWFTMSSEAKAEGMSVTATASTSLLITKQNDGDGFKTASGIIDFKDTTRALTPATAFAENKFVATYQGRVDDEGEPVLGDDNEQIMDPVYLTGSDSDLVTIGDASTVTAATGAYDGLYTAVPESASSVYYLDYTFYIGESGAATDKKLVAYFDADALKYSLHNALTIGVYVDESTKDTTKGVELVQTLNLRQVDKDGQVVVNIADSIPSALVANEAGGVDYNDAIQVTLRVYFDGALLDDTTTDITTDYFVRNGTATTQGVSFFVNFKAEAKQQPAT